ncbi:hypothetical protein D3C72_1570880 [compost metagenome]
MAFHAWMKQRIDARPKVIAHVINRALPEGRLERQAIVDMRNGFGLLSVPIRIFRKAGMAIHAALFERYPERPEVSLFKDVYADIVGLGKIDSRAMHRPAVAE